MRAGWLTQDAIPARRTYAISLPDDEEWRAQFLGALLLLTGAENWELFGELTPEQMAAEWLDIFVNFTQSENQMIPVGTITQFAGTSQPEGWFFCNGGEVSRTEYSELFDAIGTTYGIGDGATTFNIPDFRQRVPVGLDEENPTYDNIGTLAGAESVTLTATQMPSHTHLQDAHTHTQNQHTHTQDPHTHTIDGGINAAAGSVVRGLLASGVGSNNTISRSSVATNQMTTPTNNNATPTNQNAGGDGSHNNMQPYVVINYIIKY